MDELIKIDEFKTQQLPYYVKFTADIVVAKPSLYKEDIHSTLYKVIEMFNPQYLQQQYVLKVFQNVVEADNDKIVFSFIGQQDMGFQNGIMAAIADNHIRVEYFELRNDTLLLPNNGHFLASLICVCEAIGRLSTDFSLCKIDINYMVDTNARVGYHSANCHFNVVSTMNNYYVYDKTMRPTHIEKDDSMYNIVRRFLQLYKSETLCHIPYIGLDKTQFEQDYAMIWK